MMFAIRHDARSGGFGALIAAAFTLVVLVLPAGAAEPDWQEVRVKRATEVMVTAGGATLRYYRLGSDGALSFNTTGPGRLKITIRPVLPSSSAEEVSYILLIGRDAEPSIAEVRSSRASKVRWRGQAVGEAREVYHIVPSGKHSYRLNLPGDANGEALVRIEKKSGLGAEPGDPKGKTQAPYSPTSYAAAVTVISKEREATFFRATADTPVRLEVYGPTSLTVIARLEFVAGMQDKQTYRMDVREDGAPTKKGPTITTKRSDESTYRNARLKKERVPSLAESFSVSVPVGLHSYTFRPRGTAAPGVLLKFSIPARDIHRGE